MSKTRQNGRKSLVIIDNKKDCILLNRREVNFQQSDVIKVENFSFNTVSHFNYSRTNNDDTRD